MDQNDYFRGQNDFELAERRRAAAEKYVRVLVENGRDPVAAVDDLSKLLQCARELMGTATEGLAFFDELVAAVVERQAAKSN